MCEYLSTAIAKRENIEFRCDDDTTYIRLCTWYFYSNIKGHLDLGTTIMIDIRLPKN